MKRLARPKPSRERESTITLINIVFLMLIFFLIAGTLAPPLDDDVALIATREAEPAEPPEALVALADGTLRYRGEATTPEAFMSARAADQDPAAKLAADRELPAANLIDIVAALRAAGATSVRVVTERAAP
jgi:biopolymer transport protein ExbD